MPDRVERFRGVNRGGVEVVLVVPHRDADVAVTSAGFVIGQRFAIQCYRAPGSD
jgi:hypothetical protein